MIQLKTLLLGATMAAGGIVQTQADLITVAGDPIGGGQASGQTAADTFTIATATATFGTNSFPGNESPPNAIDGNQNNKYLNFGNALTGYIVTPAIGLSNVTGLFLSTGNDGPERDPLTFSLFGSTTAVASNAPGDSFSLSAFTPIVLDAPTNLATNPGRNTTPGVQPTFANTGDFTSYILVFPTIRNGQGSNSGGLMQIGEAALTGTAVPEPTSIALGLVSGLGLLGLRRRRKA